MARQALANSLPPVIASVLRPEEFDSLRQRLMQLPAPPDRARLSREDWLGALGVFLLVFVSTLPVVIPLMVKFLSAGAARATR